jgi:hypothetical protein
MLPATLRQVRIPLWGALVALPLLACGEWDEQGAARDFAREHMGCFDIEVERTENHRFSVDGCERRIDVACSEGSLHPVCIEVALRGSSGGDDGDDDGEVGELDDPEVVDVDPRVDEGIDEAHARAEVEPTGPTPAEAAIRRGLDARSADILACVDRSTVAVRVNHAADGSLSITLSGDLRSSPEEGCVRAAIGDVRVPGGEPGVVVHLVRPHPPAPSPAPHDATTTLETPPAEPVLTGTIVEELD